MLDILVLLQQKSVLTPIVTLATGSIAILSVLINNAVVSRNLTRQLRAQSRENEKKILAEAKISTIKEKRNKLEQLFIHLHDYIEEMELCFRLAGELAVINELNGQALIPKARELKDRFNRGNRELSKARILASAYSTMLDDPFTTIKTQCVPAQDLFALLCAYSFGQAEGLEYKRTINRQKIIELLQKANLTESEIKESVYAIEDSIILEIKSLVEQEQEN